MIDYILYDERGVLDPDEAAILECFKAEGDMEAFNEAVSGWPEHSWALWRMKPSDKENAIEDDSPIAWASAKKKSVTRWTAWWDEPRQYKYETNKRQKGRMNP